MYPWQNFRLLLKVFIFKTREASQNTDLDMREFSGTDRALQSIQGELLNNTSKLTKINKRIEKDAKKLKKWKMILRIPMNKGSYIKMY